MRTPYGVIATVCAILSMACGDETSPRTPKALEIIEGDGQQARTGQPLPGALRVRVIGSDDQPFAGASVQWAATRGNARLTPMQSTTDNSGHAEAQVVLESVGDVLVSAVMPGVLPVTFTLTGLDPCFFDAWPMIEVGTTVSGMLQLFDCDAHGGFLHDLFPFMLSTQQAVIAGVQSASFDPVVELFSGRPWYAFFVDSVNATRDARVKAILPGGWYALAATSIDEAMTGPYTLRLLPTPESQESCEFVMVMVGVATTQTLASTDCADPSDRSEDRFWLVLWEGETVTFTQSSLHFTPHLRLLRDGEVVAEADGSGTGPATLTFTSEDFANYYVHASSTGAQQSGEYRLFITAAETASAQLSTSGRVRPLGGIGARPGVRPGSVVPGGTAVHR